MSLSHLSKFDQFLHTCHADYPSELVDTEQSPWHASFSHSTTELKLEHSSAVSGFGYAPKAKPGRAKEPLNVKDNPCKKPRSETTCAEKKRSNFVSRLRYLDRDGQTCA